MNQSEKNKNIWDREYQKPILVSEGEKPLKAVVDFVRYLKKQKQDLANMTALDIGTGTGKNAIYLAENMKTVSGIDVSIQAIRIAKERARNAGLEVVFECGSVAQKLPYGDVSFDVVIDTMVTHCLSLDERRTYHDELLRILKPGGFWFIKTLGKTGDKNAKELINRFPGKDTDSYIMPEMGHQETVFTKETFLEQYSRGFDLISYEEEFGYPSFHGRVYKRKFIEAILRKTA